MKAAILRNRRLLNRSHPGTMAKPVPRKWSVYIPDEGHHWAIDGKHTTEAAAKAAFLKWARRNKKVPTGTYFIVDRAYE